MKQNKSPRLPKNAQKPEQIVVLGKATALTLGGSGTSIETRNQSANIWHKN